MNEEAGDSFSVGDASSCQSTTVDQSVLPNSSFGPTKLNEAWGNEFITKFRILADRVDYIVGVFEDDAGGHANESGIVVTEPYRSRTFIPKREYETKEEERAVYNAMQANIFTIIDRTGGLALWTDRFELVEEAMNLPTEPAE